MAKNDSNLLYIDGAAGVVADRKTGLKWLEGPGDLTSSEAAEHWIEKLNETTSGWRLPNIVELFSLFELDTPLLNATNDGPPRYWREEKHPSRSSVWVNVACRSPFVGYWTHVASDFFASFSFGCPFELSDRPDATNAFAVGHWAAPNISLFSPEEIVERLGFVWVVDHPESQNVFGAGEMTGGGRTTGIAVETQEAKKILLLMGSRAIAALEKYLAPCGSLGPDAAISSFEDDYDRTLFRVKGAWNRKREKWDGNTKSLRFRPCLARQGALRVLDRLRQNF